MKNKQSQKNEAHKFDMKRNKGKGNIKVLPKREVIATTENKEVIKDIEKLIYQIHQTRPRKHHIVSIALCKLRLDLQKTLYEMKGGLR